jgi:hypothetical protein
MKVSHNKSKEVPGTGKSLLPLREELTGSPKLTYHNYV